MLCKIPSKIADMPPEATLVLELSGPSLQDCQLPIRTNKLHHKIRTFDPRAQGFHRLHRAFTSCTSLDPCQNPGGVTVLCTERNVQARSKEIGNNAAHGDVPEKESSFRQSTHRSNVQARPEGRWCDDVHGDVPRKENSFHFKQVASSTPPTFRLDPEGKQYDAAVMMQGESDSK